MSNLRIETEKPYLLLVNPHSGTHKSQRIFNNCMSQLLNRFGIQYEIVFTDKALHARNFIKCCDSLNKYRGIVTVSGDGLIYEVFCGIMDRISWKDDIESTPVFVIPAGSGNGLASSISVFSGHNPKSNLVLYNTLLLTMPTVQPLDLMRVQTVTDDQFPAFLSFSWGLFANVDVGSDKFRWMGSVRFTLMAVIQIAKMNKYRGKLWYLPVSSDKALNNISDNVHGQQSNCNARNPENTLFVNQPFRFLPDISQPISDNEDWVLLDQFFVSMIATLLPYIATDAKMAPSATLNDGKIHLIIINPEASRSELLDSIGKLETGEHINSRSFRYIECLAFRLVPESDNCYMAVDGECLPNGAVQAEVMPSVARTITGPSADDTISLT